MSAKRVAVLGLGLIGKERLRAVEVLRTRGREVAVVSVMDPFASGASELAKAHGAHVATNVDQVLAANPDLVIVCTPNDTAVDLVAASLARGVRVLVEKPLGRSAAEARRLVEAAPAGSLHVGFNYRFQPGIAGVVGDARAGRFGDIVSVRAILGHGGEPKMGDTWKLDRDRVGGGCLIDPGIHMLDIFRLVARKDPEVKAVLGWSGFWKKDLEEECHLLLDGGGFAMSLELSIVRWRSTFELSVQGTEGYGIVTGRNRSYGPQRYVRGKRWGWQGGSTQRGSEEVVLETEGDDSFAAELDAVLFPTERSRDATALPPCTGADALGGMLLLEQCRARMQSVA